MRRASPVQTWLDSLPPEHSTDRPPELPGDGEAAEEDVSSDTKHEDSITDVTVIEPMNPVDIGQDAGLQVAGRDTCKSLESSPQRGAGKRLQREHSVHSEGYAPKCKNPLLRDHSLQSDASGSSGVSGGSGGSVLSVLGARRVDAEAVLLALGFGPSRRRQHRATIPDRFLHPSKLKGISTEEFIRSEQHSMRVHDCGVFGYRGLTGSRHVAASSIVAKIMECILQHPSRQDLGLLARHSTDHQQ